MRYKRFKNAGVSVSALAVGTWAIEAPGTTARSTGVIRYEPYEP